jgi:starch phosphorylase
LTRQRLVSAAPKSQESEGSAIRLQLGIPGEGPYLKEHRMTPRTKKAPAARTQEARVLEQAREMPSSRTGMDVETLRRAYIDHLQYTQGKDEHTATALDRFQAVASAVRDRLVNRWIQTQQSYYKADSKRIYYLSLEFLMGRALGNNLLNLR